MNSGSRVSVWGNVGSDPKLREFDNGKAASFSVAVNTGRDKKTVEWYRVVVWGKLADLVMDSVSKGSGVKVVGHLRSRVAAVDPVKGLPREFVEVVGKRVGLYVSEDELSWLEVEGGGERPRAAAAGVK